MKKSALTSVILLLALIMVDFSHAAERERSSWSQNLYKGIRATDLLTSRMVSKDGAFLGQVRNIELANNGRIATVIAEKAGIGLSQGFVFKLRWDQVLQPFRAGTIVADLANHRSDRLKPYDSERDDTGSTFRVLEVIGDYARLQTGLGYGVVSDIVFSRDGRMHAVLVERDAPHSGIFAFRYPGGTGRWNPAMSYYGLPFVTSDQADAAGFKVDQEKFGAEAG